MNIQHTKTGLMSSPYTKTGFINIQQTKTGFINIQDWVFNLPSSLSSLSTLASEFLATKKKKQNCKNIASIVISYMLITPIYAYW